MTARQKRVLASSLKEPRGVRVVPVSGYQRYLCHLLDKSLVQRTTANTYLIQRPTAQWPSRPVLAQSASTPQVLFVHCCQTRYVLLGRLSAHMKHRQVQLYRVEVQSVNSQLKDCLKHECGRVSRVRVTLSRSLLYSSLGTVTHSFNSVVKQLLVYNLLVKITSSTASCQECNYSFRSKYRDIGLSLRNIKSLKFLNPLGRAIVRKYSTASDCDGAAIISASSCSRSAQSE